MKRSHHKKGLPWVEDMARDMRHGVRLTARSPGFTAVVVLILALGIGGNAGIFSVASSVVLQALPYEDSGQLLYLSTQFRSSDSGTLPVSPPEYMEFREMNQSFIAVGAGMTGEVNFTGGDRPARVRSAFVDTHLLDVLGIQTVEGRGFDVGETEVAGPAGPIQPPAQPVAILSHQLWRTAFGGQPMLGQEIEVDGRDHEVIGIMAPEADVMDHRTEIWLPLGLNPANRQNRAQHSLHVIGRLRDGTGMEAAQRELDALMETWVERVGVQPGPGNAGHVFTPLTGEGGHVFTMEPLRERIVGVADRSIWVLQAAVGLVLLIACVNVAALLLARSEGRRREFATRAALGGGHGRLVRQLFAEGMVFSAAGGVLGLILAYSGLRILIAAYPDSFPRMAEVAVDPSTLLFTTTAVIVTGILFGLTPVVQISETAGGDALGHGETRGATGRVRHRIRSGLVLVEISMTVILVVGAGLLVRTIYNLTAVDAGFDPSRLVTFSITLPDTNYIISGNRARTYEQVLESVRRIAGVESVTAVSGLPPSFPAVGAGTDFENYVPSAQGPVEAIDYYQFVVPGYFRTMGIPIVEGRAFSDSDTVSEALVAVVNETLVRTFFPEQNPIGRRFRRCGQCNDAEDPWITIVGVARDVKQDGLDRDSGTQAYLLVQQQLVLPSPPPIVLAPGTMNYVLQTALPPGVLAQPIQDAVAEVDATVPVVRLTPMDAIFAESMSRPSLMAQLTASFAGVSLVLAAIGAYGLVAAVAGQRRREIGIRMALGASRGDILWRMLGEITALTAVGVAIGLGGALALNRLMESLLFGVQAADTTTLVIAIATVGVGATIASAFPAWHASRLDLNTILKNG